MKPLPAPSIFKWLVAFAWTALVSFAPPQVHAIPVVPGAVGFGTDTPAGRGGQIVRVTTLADDYQNPPVGSLRWAIERVVGPRVVVFEVAGVIELRRNLIIRATDSSGDHGFLTVAGQTAPPPGITLKNAGIVIHAHDVLLQHLAIRPGTATTTGPGWDLPALDNRDAVSVGAPAGGTGQNVVLDHLSCTWAGDEIVSVWSDAGAATDITFIHCILGEPILNAGHSKGAHGFGPLSGRNAANVTMARNIMAFNFGRNPLIRDRTSGAQIVNNFIYSPGVWPTGAIYLAGPGGFAGRPITNSVVGNVVVRKPLPFSVTMGRADGTFPVENYTTYYNTSIYVHDDMPAGAQLFLADNTVFNPQENRWYPTNGDAWSSSIFRDSSVNRVNRLAADPYASSGGSAWMPWPSAEVEARLLAAAGKFPGRRDAIDATLIRKIRERSGTYVAFEADLGPDPWAPANVQSIRPLVTPENPDADDDQDGYTNLEEWLHAMAADVERTAPIEPPPAAGEFQKSSGEARLLNLSSRVAVGGGAGTPAPGFVLAGEGEKTVLVRAVGPTLASFGVTGALADPRLSLMRDSSLLAANDDWLASTAATMTRAGAFTLAPGTKDAALVATVRAGAYTAPLGAAEAATGVALLEIYDASSTQTAAAIVNASTRAHVGTGDSILIPGFVVAGAGTLRVLLRAAGPALQAFGVGDALADPRLILQQGDTTLAANDNWSEGANAAEIQAVAAHVGAFALPTGSRDAAQLATLTAGAYTVSISGVNNTTGSALFELYVVR